MSRLLVVGTGAIGGYVASVLARHDLDVTVLTRGANLAAIRSDGVRIEGGPDAGVGRPLALEDVSDQEPYDVVLVATKAPDTAAAVAALGDRLAPDGVVVALQNGVGRGAHVSALLGRDAGLERDPQRLRGDRRRLERGDPPLGLDQ